MASDAVRDPTALVDIRGVVPWLSRPGETDREQSRHRAPGRLNQFRTLSRARCETFKVTEKKGNVWRAGTWEREHAETWLAWRASQASARQRQLVAVIQAVGAIVQQMLDDEPSARRVIQQLPATLSRCDRLDFSTPEQCVAYMIWHLADRYDRAIQVLDKLFSAGHLPLRQRRLSVLEVGAGPAPALYAVRDYYDDLITWLAGTSSNLHVSNVTDLHAMDRGPAWSRLLHQLSETLIGFLQPHSETTLPFETTYQELAGFSAKQQHTRAIEARARAIGDEFDRADDPTHRNEHQDQRAGTCRSGRLTSQPGTAPFVIYTGAGTQPSPESARQRSSHHPASSGTITKSRLRHTRAPFGVMLTGSASKIHRSAGGPSIRRPTWSPAAASCGRADRARLIDVHGFKGR
jgi:hypothetical protein